MPLPIQHDPVDVPRSGRRSACPGLLRFAPALDGEICRVKLPCGRLDAAQALRLADAAELFGSGIVDVTNRANLQIRGVRPERAAALTDALVAAGLGPLTSGGDDVRNVMTSPTAGVDREQKLDTRPLADRLLETLQTHAAYHALSPKFSILLDGGEAVAPVDHPHDIWLAALSGTEASARFAFGIAGCPPLIGSPSGPMGAVAADHAHDLVAALLDVFLELADDRADVTRFRHLRAGFSDGEIIDRIARRVAFRIRPGCEIATWRRHAPAALAHLGAHPQRQDGWAYVGAVPPLGRLAAATLRSLGHIATALGDGTLRATPWRGVLLPNVAASRAAEAVRQLEAVGLLCRADDPLATMIACSGSSGCASSLADTQSDGFALAARLRLRRSAPTIHLSGCTKSCASPVQAPATLVGVGQGRYDLFIRDAGGASRFGRVLARDIDIDEAAQLLAEPGSDPGE